MQKLLQNSYGIVLYFFVMHFSLQASPAVASRTFFMPRSSGSDLALQHAGTYQFNYAYEPKERFFWHTSTFYQASTNRTDIARYFMPADKTSLTVKGALAVGSADISATWLQIAGKNSDSQGNTVPAGLGYVNDELNGTTTRGQIELYLNEFSSSISIKPTYNVVGALFQSYYNMAAIDKRLWFSCDMPFVQVETCAHLHESGIQNAATSRSNVDDFVITNDSAEVTRHERSSIVTPLNATQAFNNPMWQYGKISTEALKRAGFADMQLKLGYNLLRFKAFRANIYGHCSVPTSYKPTAQYMFEPIIGNAGHWGLGGGTCIDVSFVTGKQFNISLCTNLDYLYFFEDSELRSMDLTANGPWSRYLLVVDTKNEPLASQRVVQPGINFFTRRVNVSPKHDINLISSLRLGVSSFFAEVGYNLWYKNAETVTLKDSLPEGLAIAGASYGAIDADAPFEVRTFSQAKISSPMVSPPGSPADAWHTDDSPTRPITLSSSDLNLSSAAHPKRFSHKLFLTGGANFDWQQRPVQVGVGFSYEFAENNRSLDLWGFLVKMSVFV